jgi:hypothetical protein
MSRLRLTIVSDIHYAGPAERTRSDFAWSNVANPFAGLLAWFWRALVWERNPTARHYLLDEFLASAPEADLVVANGDYSCDTAFIGVSDPAARQSAQECLSKLRQRFGDRFHGTIGDHELGKTGLGTRLGGLRLDSFARCVGELGLEPFWRVAAGDYVLLGVTSSLIALPLYSPELLAEERAEWEQLREAHLQEIRRAFSNLRSRERVLLFCHDPSALPFLWREDAVRNQLGRVEQTIVGHLHSPLILAPARWLAGMPAIRFLGPFVRRATLALHEARHWRLFRVRLCPALRGIVWRRGGYFSVELDGSADVEATFHFHPMAGSTPAGHQD